MIFGVTEYKFELQLTVRSPEPFCQVELGHLEFAIANLVMCVACGVFEQNL